MFSYTVKVYPIQNPKSKILAYASLLIDGVFEVTGFKIFDGVNGLFVKPPQHKGKNKQGEEEWYDDARFVGETAKEIREEVYSTIVSSYNSNVRNSSKTTTANLQSEINKNSQPAKQTNRPLW